MKKRTISSLTVKFTDANSITLANTNTATAAYENFLHGKGFINTEANPMVAYPYHSIFSMTPTYAATEEDAPTDTFCTPEN